MKHFWFPLVALCVLPLPVAYSTWHRYMTWWFWRHGTVMVDNTAHGFIHQRFDDSAVLITRTDTSPRQSYLVSLFGRKTLIHCGAWSAPRFLTFPIGDVNSPCSVFSDTASADSDQHVYPENATLVVQGNTVSFTTVSGKHIQAAW